MRSNTDNIVQVQGIELLDAGQVEDAWGGKAPFYQVGTVNVNAAAATGTGIMVAPNSTIVFMRLYITTAAVGTHTLTIGSSADPDALTTTVSITSQRDVIDLMESTTGKVGSLLDFGSTSDGGPVEITTDMNVADATGRAKLVVGYIADGDA